jgi:hypothetical protein
MASAVSEICHSGSKIFRVIAVALRWKVIASVCFIYVAATRASEHLIGDSAVAVFSAGRIALVQLPPQSYAVGTSSRIVRILSMLRLQFLKVVSSVFLMLAITCMPVMAQTSVPLRSADDRDVGSVVLVEMPAGSSSHS